MPASSRAPARSRSSRRTDAPSSATLSGAASSRTAPSSGARRTIRPSEVRTSSTAEAPNGDRPDQTSLRGSIRLGSSRSWTSSSTVHPSPRSGSRTRRHSRTRPAMTAPLRTHVVTASARARTLAGSSDAGSHGSAETSDRAHASATAGRPPRLGTSVSLSPASRLRTVASTASARSCAARRWPAPDGSTTKPAIKDRCDAAGNGHHQERLRPSGSTLRPGTTRPAATMARATSSTASRSGSRTVVVGRRATVHSMTAGARPVRDWPPASL